MSVTGIAGPGGGSDDKPVGLVHLCVIGNRTALARQIRLPGSRADALHMIRELIPSAASAAR